MKTLFLLFFVITSTYAQYPVGHLQKTFTDPSRGNRSIATEIYYPATAAGNNVPMAAGQFPVLVFGHGFVMTYSAYSVVWNALVPSGYIMVFPTTESSFSPSHLDFGKDIAFLVGAMKAEGLNASSPFQNAIAPTSAVMGHSMGGGSAYLAMQYDTTITALATLAAAITNPSSVISATDITKPALSLAGGNDCVTPPAQHQLLMYDSLASICKTYVSITGGSHCQFAAYNFNCAFGEGTCTPAPAITATVQQNTAFALLLPWLNFYLKNDCAAGTQFQNLITAGAGINSQQNCTLNCVTTPINKIENLNFDIFPQPASQAVTLRFSSEMLGVQIKIFNALGQEVYVSDLVSGNQVTVSTDLLGNGTYSLGLYKQDKLLIIKNLVIVK